MAALTDYELKLRGRSWCNNLRQNGIIADDMALQNCLSAFPMSSAIANSGDSTTGQVLQIQPPSSEKRSYNYSIYGGEEISGMDSTSISPSDNDQFLIYNSDKKYLTYDENPFGANYARVDISINAAPATFQWTLINRGGDKYSILGSNGKFLSLDKDRKLVVSSGEINNFAIWRLGKIDNYATFESVQYPSNWLASKNDDIFLNDNNFDSAKWLMTNLTSSDNTNINGSMNSENDTVFSDLLNDKTVLDTQVATLIKKTIKLKTAIEILKQVSTTVSSNIVKMQDMYIDKININNNLIKSNASSSGMDGYIAESKIKEMRDKWSAYQNDLLDKLTTVINTTTKEYNDNLAELNTKFKKYDDFIMKLNKVSDDIKKRMNSNTQTIDEQIGKSNILESSNSQLAFKKEKDAHMKIIAEINSSNYAQVENSEFRWLVIKIIGIILLVIITLLLFQKTLNLYNTNISK